MGYIIYSDNSNDYTDMFNNIPIIVTFMQKIAEALGESVATVFFNETA